MSTHGGDFAGRSGEEESGEFSESENSESKSRSRSRSSTTGEATGSNSVTSTSHSTSGTESSPSEAPKEEDFTSETSESASSRGSKADEDVKMGSEDRNYLNSLSPSDYLKVTGVAKELEELLFIVARQRPKLPFISTQKCVNYYMGCYLKANNRRLPRETREWYKRALDKFDRDMEDAFTDTKNELDFEKHLDDFIQLESIPINERLPCF